MQFVQINNSSETFTSDASGAIATHIWEVCRRVDERPLVISQSSSGATYEGVDVELLPAWPQRVQGWRELPRRLMRKLTGWREAEQRNHAKNVVRVLKRRGLTSGRLLLHNDPEMAVYIKEQCPNAFVVHHFHNPVIAKEPFLSRFRGSVNGVSAVSRYVADEVRRIYHCRNVDVAYNGVDLERFQPVSRKRRERITFNFLGRTGIEKAPDVLLRACLRLALDGIPLRVQMIGANHWGRWEPDAYQSQLGNLYEELLKAGAEVHATGHISRKEVPEQLTHADVHVVPSRWQEPCALSLLEGMSAGLAVVASRTGGTPEILGNEGLLFTKDSVEELATHLRKLSADEVLRNALAHRARLRAQFFTWERCWQGLRRTLFLEP